MTNNPKAPKEDKLDDIAYSIIMRVIDPDDMEGRLIEGRIRLRDEALAQINNYIKEQMLSIVGEDEKIWEPALRNAAHPEYIEGYYAGMNSMKDTLRKKTNERFK